MIESFNRRELKEHRGLQCPVFVFFAFFAVNQAQFHFVFDAIKRLIADDEARKSGPRREIGFHTIPTA